MKQPGQPGQKRIQRQEESGQNGRPKAPQVSNNEDDAHDAQAVHNGYCSAAPVEKDRQLPVCFHVVGREIGHRREPVVSRSRLRRHGQLHRDPERTQPGCDDAGMAGDQRVCPAAGENRFAKEDRAIGPDGFIGRHIAANGHQAWKQADKKQRDREQPNDPAGRRSALPYARC